MSKPKLTEADILFELFLPMMCTEKHESMVHFKGKIELHMSGETPRVWNLTGGAAPYVQRGPIEGADLTITMTEQMVKDIVLGEDIKPEDALKSGAVTVSGDRAVLKSLQMSFEEATNLLGTMLKR